MSTSYGTITITNETEAKKAARYFLHSSGGSYVIAGNSQSFNPSDESTYGFNVRSGTNEIQLRYNNKVLSEWRGGDGTQNSNLVFYDTTNAASTQLALKKLMELTSVGLNFYKKGDDSTAAASLTANGLEIKEGSITLGTEDQTTHRHPFEVNSNGELYAENATISGDIYAAYIEAKSGDIGGWKVTDHIDYELNPSYSAWYVTDYNQTKSFATTYSYPVQEVIPKKVKIKFSGSLNGLNINDNVIYEYDITELDTDYIIEYSGLNVGKAKLTFDGTDTITFYLTKILDDGIILELRGLNYILRNNNVGALYYDNPVPGKAQNSIVLSGQGVYSKSSIAGSDTSGNTWKIAVGNNFGVTTNGTLYAEGARINGYIDATSGQIGGWKLEARGGDGQGSLWYSTTSETTPVIGTSLLVLSPGFQSSTSIGGSSGSKYWALTVKDKFGVTTSGDLYANATHITGEITATSGSIGGWKIGGDTAHSLWYSSSSSITTPADALGSGLILSPGGIYSSTKPGGSTSVLPAEKTWAFTAGNKFGVTTDGELYGSGVTITGYATENYADSAADSAAEEAVEQYIKVDANGIKIAKNVGSATSYNYIDSEGMKIYQNNTPIAEFGSTIRLGSTDDIYTTFDSYGMSITHPFYQKVFGLQVPDIPYMISRESNVNYDSNPKFAYASFDTSGVPYGISSITLTTAQGPVSDPDVYKSFFEAITISYGQYTRITIDLDRYSGANLVSIQCVFFMNKPIYLQLGTFCQDDNSRNIFVIGDYQNETYSRTAFSVSYDGDTQIGGKLYFSDERVVGATLSGTSTPSSSMGAIGDIYIKYTS